jgi:hypothetical protein
MSAQGVWKTLSVGIRISVGERHSGTGGLPASRSLRFGKVEKRTFGEMRSPAEPGTEVDDYFRSSGVPYADSRYPPPQLPYV